MRSFRALAEAETLKPLIDAFPIRNLCHGLFGRASAKQFIFQGAHTHTHSSPPAAQSAAEIEACDTQETTTIILRSWKANRSHSSVGDRVRLGHDVECI